MFKVHNKDIGRTTSVTKRHTQQSIGVIIKIFCTVFLLLNLNIFMLACVPSWQYNKNKTK